jgi:RNase H-fold protein (predicted Holliday junction resolvase)
MGLFSKDIKTMDDLLLHGLQDIYYAEQQILKALPKMIDKATNRDLVTGLKGHLEETNKQVERLEKAFGNSASRRAARNVLPSTASSRKRMRRPARSKTRRYSMRRSSLTRRRSNITRYAATAR